MKKYSLSIGLILLSSVLLISGCGNSDENSNSKSTSNQEIFSGKIEKNKTIKVLENDTAISKGYFKELIKAFNEAYADKGIKAVDANTDQYVDLAKDGPYGYGPDVLYQANDVIMKYAEDKHVYPIPVQKIDAYKQISKNAWNAFKIKKDGNFYYCGVPVNVQTPMLYYRKDLLPTNWKKSWDKDSNDIPDMVENWKDMYEFSKQRHQQNQDKFGYMESLDDTYFSSGYLFSYGAFIFGKNNTDPSTVGFAHGNSYYGAKVIQQLASVMNEESIDDTIKTSAYSKLGNGTYFATMSTPDVYSTFMDELIKYYVSQGKNTDEAKQLANDNLVMTTVPKLPASGDLTSQETKLIDMKTMGGVNGYAISAYTKAPNASLAFVNFATKYKMIKKRYELLGVVPVRKDIIKEIKGVSEGVFTQLEHKNIVLMPSNAAVAQIWTPTKTYFSDITKDVFRPESEKKYKDDESLKKGLEKVDQQISDAIHTLE